MYLFNVVIPKELSIEQLIKESPPVGIKNFSAEKLKYLVSTILQIPSRNPKLKIKDGFTPVNAKLLRKHVKDYNAYLSYLVKTGVLETDNCFIVGEKSRYYRFTEKYTGIDFKEEQITDYKLYNNFYGISRKSVTTSTAQENYPNLTNWFNDGLNIDSTVAYEYNQLQYEYKKDNPETWDEELVDNKRVKLDPVNQFKNAYFGITELKNKHYYYSVDTSGNRFHSNLTNLKSEHRNALTYEGEQLCAIDLKNSQPYNSIIFFQESFWSKNNKLLIPSNKFNPPFNLSSIILSQLPEYHNKPDVLKYIDLSVSGNIYLEYGKKLYNNPSYTIGTDADKRILKDYFFSMFYGHNQKSYSGYKKVLVDEYPNVIKLFELIKTNSHATLPILLQRIESDLFLNKIAKRLSREHKYIPIYTIHDSIATTLQYLDYVESVVKDECYTLTGKQPSLRREYWLLDKLLNNNKAA